MKLINILPSLPICLIYLRIMTVFHFSVRQLTFSLQISMNVLLIHVKIPDSVLTASTPSLVCVTQTIMDLAVKTVCNETLNCSLTYTCISVLDF